MKAERSVLLAGLVIAGAAVAAYHNTFAVPFVFDDEQSIVHNPSIRSLATALQPPGGWGFTVSGRPVLNLSLALNFAISGTAVWSYHALNLLIHAAAGLALFGLVRRTLHQPIMAKTFAGRELPVALAVALLWTLHPLQTESVTYIIQRAESLMGLFYFLTLYAVLRAATTPASRGWSVVAVAACALGMATKEVMVTAPVVAVLFDRTFLAGSLRAVWTQRRGLHIVLSATWLLLAWLVLSAGGDRGGTYALTPAAFGGYWLTQFEAVARYLWLSVWPSPLIFEYGVTREVHWTAALPYALPVLALAAATLWALVRRPVAGFLGAMLFLVLAPTSLMPGVTQTIVEHRMYVPLAAVVALLVGWVISLAGRRALYACIVLAVVAGGLTMARNRVYQDELTLWQDTVAKRPTSAKAQNNLGRLHFQRGEFADALRRYDLALQHEPESAQTHYNRGLTLEALGRSGEAIAALAEAERILPYFGQAQWRRAVLLLQAGRAEEAIAPAQAAAARLVEPAEAYFTLEQSLAETGRIPAAMDAYAAAVRYRDDHGEVRLNLGVLLAQAGRLPEARVQLEVAARQRPQLPEAHVNLGIVLAESGDLAAAVASYERALQLRPDYPAAHYNLGVTLLRLGRMDDGRRHLIAAGDFPPAREMLERLRGE